MIQNLRWPSVKHGNIGAVAGVIDHWCIKMVHVQEISSSLTPIAISRNSWLEITNDHLRDWNMSSLKYFLYESQLLTCLVFIVHGCYPVIKLNKCVLHLIFTSKYKANHGPNLSCLWQLKHASRRGTLTQSVIRTRG